MHNSQLFCTLLLSCRAEGRRPAVETSRPIGAFTFTNHTRSAQPAKDETFECSPSPGVAADCRRKAPNRPAVMSSGGPQARSRDIPTFRNFYPCDSHGFTLVPPSGPLDCARGDRPEWLRLARGDKKMHIFCCKSGKMYYLWDKRSAGKARFALPLTVNVRNLPV